jgi:hypothetical protein
MQQRRDPDDGSFTIIGDEEELSKLRDGFSGAFGADDPLVEELDAIIGSSSGRTLEFKMEPGTAAEITDFMEEDEDPEIARIGGEMRAEMDEVMAKLERES